jgi:hypothetical protein
MSHVTAAQRESQLNRIRGLLSKTVANGCTEAEARLAAEAVDRLLGLYEIDLDEVTVRQQEIVQLEVACPYDHVVVTNAAADIARFTDCKIWRNKRPDRIVFFGFKVDTQIAEYLAHLFRRAVDRDIVTVTLFYPAYDARSPKQKEEFRFSHAVGMASRLGERLTELKSKRDFTTRAGGTDLVAIKKPMVDDAFKGLGLTLSKSRGGRAARDRDAYQSGRASAERVALNAGVHGRAQMDGRLR